LEELSPQDEELVLSLDKELLQRAFTHPINKRLAWLGDSVIYLAVTEHLYRTSNNKAGSLDPERQKIIGNDNLKQSIAQRFYLRSRINVPTSERDPNARRILASAFEALTGAIYLGKGYDVAAAFARRNLIQS